MKTDLKNLQAWLDGDISYLELSRRCKRTPPGASGYYLRVLRKVLSDKGIRLHE